MNRILATFFIILIVIIFFDPPIVSAEEKDHFKTTPTLNEGKKWRIAYYEGGFQDNYLNYLQATIKGLIELGWLDEKEVPSFESTQATWDWLSAKAKSNYVEFVKDAFYSSNWDANLRDRSRMELLRRVNQARDIDLVIGMGTWAGKDLATNEHKTPVVVTSVSNPVQAGIIKNYDSSGFDHVFVRVDPLRYERQVRLFHKIVGFKKLGVAFENSVFGRSYAAIDQIEKVAVERNFEVVPCFTVSDTKDQRQADESVVKCFQELSPKVDAIYVTMQGGVNKNTLPTLVKLSNEHRVATFSQAGSDEVRYGIFLSISRGGGFKPVGLFLAATIAKIFNGAKPGQLNQVFEESPNIAINLKTAEIIGQYLYADVLAAADEVYRDIGEPK